MSSELEIKYEMKIKQLMMIRRLNETFFTVAFVAISCLGAFGAIMLAGGHDNILEKICTFCGTMSFSFIVFFSLSLNLPDADTIDKFPVEVLSDKFSEKVKKTSKRMFCVFWCGMAFLLASLFLHLFLS